MKKQVVFIHGAESFSDYNAFLRYLQTVPIEDPLAEHPKRWKNTLREELGCNYEVFLPSMPNATDAKYEEWKIWFERHFAFLRDGVILIGHSQGGYFLAKYLSENMMPMQVRALFLIAAPMEPDNFGGEDGGDFAFEIKKLQNLEKQVDNVFIYHSKDDNIVSVKHAEKYKKAMPKAHIVLFENKGHFLMETFPELIEQVQNLG